ncbi:MAG: peptidase M20, partial [Clostridia bacterium]|nr:peptidase M20 [Clostridia bacterium]
MLVLYILLGLLALLLAAILIRTVLFRPKDSVCTSAEPVEFDREGAVDALQKLVQCRTVSYYDHALEDEAEFAKLIDLLPKLYPHVWETCPL